MRTVTISLVTMACAAVAVVLLVKGDFEQAMTALGVCSLLMIFEAYKRENIRLKAALDTIIAIETPCAAPDARKMAAVAREARGNSNAQKETHNV